MAEKDPLSIELDPNYLVRIIDAAVVTTTEVVNSHFEYLTKADLSKPIEPAYSEEIVFRFQGPNFDAEQRRTLNENWILAKAFQDLLRAVRHALEEAHAITSVLNKRYKVSSNSTLEDFLRPFRSKASSKKFPDLLEEVNRQLETALDFSDSYLSLQIARNCLEHRNGVITKIETHGGDTFNFSIPRMKVFYLRNEEEIELKKGERVEPDKGKEHADILMKIEQRALSVALGDRLAFKLSDFNEIAFACHHMGVQLAQKLPKPAVLDN